MLSLVIVVSIARPDIVIADFEKPTYGNWKVTGTAFGIGPAHGTLAGQMLVDGFEGKGLVNSFNGGDGSTGSLTSPKFRILRPNMSFLLGGGYHPGKTCIDLVIEGRVVASSTGKAKTPQDREHLDWVSWDVSKFAGKNAQIQILDLDSGGWGHINVDSITQCDQPKSEFDPAQDRISGVHNAMRTMYHPPKPEPLYHEAYRPQFHFTAKKNWLNDPNGLVFSDGEFHLFFQHNPGGIQWGDMHWGHAVSKDLFHWKELPIALSPTKLGTNFSGSAAIDAGNTTKFGKLGVPPLAAMYTAAGKPFTQCLVYSTDKGRTWTEYDKNPVLDHIAGENRDPRIFWHEPTREWKMALYLDGDEFAIFGSKDLKQWHELSRLHIPGSSECPELFQMPVEGEKNESKWIFYGANCRYLVGTFDGKTFTPETEPRMLDFGQFYASQTYSNAPNGRRIQIGWMNGQGPLPNMPFNQQMGVPSDLVLRKGGEGYVILRTPAHEIEQLWSKTLKGENLTLAKANDTLGKLKGGAYDISLSFQLKIGAPIRIDIGGQELTIDPEHKSIKFLGREAPLTITVGRVDIRMLIDRSSAEFFLQDGSVSLTMYLPPDNVKPVNRKVALAYDEREVALERLVAHEIKSAW